MLKGQMLEIAWIPRLFVIVSVVFVSTFVNGAVIDTLEIDLSSNNEIYQSQAASIQVLDNNSRKVDMPSIGTVKPQPNGAYCIAPKISGIDGRFRLRAQVLEQRCGTVGIGNFRDSPQNYIYVAKSVDAPQETPIAPLKLKILRRDR